MKKNIFSKSLLFILLIFVASSFKSSFKEIFDQDSQITAKDLIKLSVDYHDPKGNWKNFKSTIQMNALITRKGEEQETSKSELVFNNQKGVFKMYSLSDEIEFRGEISKDTCYNKASNELSPELSKKYKKILGCEGIQFWKDYYSYLIGMPMKLMDPEAIVNDTIFERTYNDVKYDVVKVTYEPLEKNPIWYFYFNRKNHAFELCKFTSREDENRGGEYIIYNKEEMVQGMRLKSEQIWLYNTAKLDTLAVDNLKFISK